jgi:hypothetical protein
LPEQAARAPLADAVPEPAAPATAITPPSPGPQRAVPGLTPGWPDWLVTQASSPGDAGQQGGTYCRNPRCLPARKNQHDRNPGGCLVLPHHTTRSPGRLGRCQAPGHPESCRICQHLPQTMPSDEWRPRRFRRDRSRRAGRGVGTRPRCGPGACPRARSAESITASGRLAVTTAGRAGSPLAPPSSGRQGPLHLRVCLSAAGGQCGGRWPGGYRVA